MGNINISDLRPAGADLFLDSESYLNDLTEGEMTNTLGGDSLCFCSLYFCNIIISNRVCIFGNGGQGSGGGKGGNGNGGQGSGGGRGGILIGRGQIP